MIGDCLNAIRWHLLNVFSVALSYQHYKMGRNNNQILHQLHTNRRNLLPSIQSRIVLLKRPLHHFPKQYKPLKETGIVFYVYYPNHCANSDSYMKQAEINAKYFKQRDPSVSSLVTFHS